MLPVALLGFFALAGSAYAQTPTPAQHPGFFGGLVQYIEQKFGLDKSQVQTAVSEYRAQRKASITPRPTLTSQQLDDREKMRLDTLVSAGKITAAQESAIIAELASLRSKYNLSSLQSMTQEQRITAMTGFRSDLVAWATAQNIPLGYVMPEARMDRRGEMGRARFGKLNNGTQISPTPTP